MELKWKHLNFLGFRMFSHHRLRNRNRPNRSRPEIFLCSDLVATLRKLLDGCTAFWQLQKRHDASLDLQCPRKTPKDDMESSHILFLKKYYTNFCYFFLQCQCVGLFFTSPHMVFWKNDTCFCKEALLGPELPCFPAPDNVLSVKRFVKQKLKGRASPFLRQIFPNWSENSLLARSFPLAGK